jgi:hypothetical protein
VNTDPLVAQLFDEFVDAHVSGQRPNVREYLLRAGSADSELGGLIDRFLELAPIEESDEETIVVLNARLEHLTPLTAARTRIPLRVDEVVEGLREALGLGDALRARLRTAYQELEAEQLDPSGVHERVWEALRSILRLDPRRLITREPLVFGAVAYLRAAEFDAIPAAADRVLVERRQPDEVDRLFRGSGLE